MGDDAVILEGVEAPQAYRGGPFAPGLSRPKPELA